MTKSDPSYQGLLAAGYSPEQIRTCPLGDPCPCQCVNVRIKQPLPKDCGLAK
jgi:hypothetical protein